MFIFVRLGTRSPNDFIQLLNQKNEVIQKKCLEKITNLTQMIDTKVMLGDSTITEQKTFDPKLVIDYFQKINDSLKYRAISIFPSVRLAIFPVLLKWLTD